MSPLLRSTKRTQKIFEHTFVGGRVFKPGEEIESLRLGQIAAVVKAASDGGQVFHADAHVLRLLFNLVPAVERARFVCAAVRCIEVGASQAAANQPSCSHP